MRRVNKYAVFIFILFILIQGVALTFPGDSAGGEMVAYYHDIKLDGVFRDGGEFKITVDMKPHDGTKPCRNWYYIGTDGADPNIIVGNVSLTVNDKNIIIPEALTCDLANIHVQNGVWIMDSEETKLLKLRGGDAAGAYTAIFTIENSSLKNRVIRTRDENGNIKDDILELGFDGNLFEKSKY